MNNNWFDINQVIYKLQKNFSGIMQFPFHSLVVHFPAALIPISLLMFLIFIYSRKLIFERISILLLGFSFIFLIFSVITGIIDWNNQYYLIFSPIFLLKIFLSIILSLLIISIWIIRNKHIKQNTLSNLSRGYSYILLYCLLFPVVAVLVFFGNYLIYPKNFIINDENVRVGYSLYINKCNSCHPYGQAIYDPFLFPGSEIEFGSKSVIHSKYIYDKSNLLNYIRNPKRMPAINKSNLSDYEFNFLFHYIKYLKNGNQDSLSFDK